MVHVKKRVPKIKNFEDYPKVDYSKVLKTCLRDCRRWKIPISKKIKQEVMFVKRRDCYALCEKLNTGFFQISYTTTGFDEYGMSEEAIYNLFMHELCHTISGCFNHLAEWKGWVKKLNEHGCKINPYPYSRKKEFQELY